MRYVLISDIHGNLEALQAVLEFVRKLGTHQLYCLGDVSATAPTRSRASTPSRTRRTSFWRATTTSPSPALSDRRTSTRSRTKWSSGPGGRWTRRISKTLSNMPLVYIDGDYLFTHASPIEPMQFRTSARSRTSPRSFSAIGQRFCFVGHTHLPVLVTMQRTDRRAGDRPDNRVTIEEGIPLLHQRGKRRTAARQQPRRVRRVLDEESGTIEFLRIPYDISSCQNKILSEGLPSYLAERLMLAR